MLERYSFIPVFTLLMGGAAWWSTQIGPNTSDIAPMIKGMKGEAASLQVRRRELVEFLDRAVSFERYYHSFYGKYSTSFSKMGLVVPANVSQIYQVKITEADTRRLLILATLQPGAAILDSGLMPPSTGSATGLALGSGSGESALGDISDKQTGDVASINQDYNFQANFKTPPPRASYLKVQAIKHLRALRDAPAGQGVEEQGVYKNFFKYTAQNLTELDEANSGETPKRSVSARGLRPPVAGVFLEIDEKHLKGNADLEMELTLLSDSLSDPFLESTKPGLVKGKNLGILGASAEENVAGEAAESFASEGSPNEQIKFAQEVFYREIGRYAKSWSELAKIVRFDVDQQAVAGELSVQEQGVKAAPAHTRGSKIAAGQYVQHSGVHRTISHVQVRDKQAAVFSESPQHSFAGPNRGPSFPLNSPPNSPRASQPNPNRHGLEIEQVEFDELEQ